MGVGTAANDGKSLTGQRSAEDPLPGHNRVLFFIQGGRVYSAAEHQPLTPKTSCGDTVSACDFNM